MQQRVETTRRKGCYLKTINYVIYNMPDLMETNNKSIVKCQMGSNDHAQAFKFWQILFYHRVATESLIKYAQT